MRKKEIYKYLNQGVQALTQQGKFDNGWDFKVSQGEAIPAYAEYLNDPKTTLEDKLSGYFEMPTGTGKTAVFLNTAVKAYEAAQADGKDFRTFIVVPSTKLLNDTKNKDVKENAPHLMDKVGLYGDGKKDLSKPFTIISYNAFVSLTEDRTITPADVDLLISDEAHRGTSERRVDDVFSQYEGNTAMIAFTATSKFDEEKTVELTHKNKVYEKALPQAIRDDELAVYAQVQLLVIRAEPVDEFTLHEMFNDEAIESGWYKRKLRQEAWNKAVVRKFREGRDQHTQDLLTDNQAAFFTDDTAQADKLANMLNADITLQQRAVAMGYKDVAVSIHTNGISRPEQKRRMKAYERGEYMAVVGDSKFKEGFDHKPLKTAFDFPRGSLVDKAQILGRILRKWFNKLKERFEGATMIDTIVYNGSDDPEVDKQMRANALRRAILAQSILEGTYVLSDHAPAPYTPSEDAESGPTNYIFSDDANVEEYTTQEELYLLLSERAELRRDHYVEISEEDLAFLQAEAKRTKLKGYAIFKYIQNPLEGMNAEVCDSIISGRKKSVPQNWIDSLRQAYAGQPDTVYVPISQEDLFFLQAEKKRTGLGGRAVFKYIQSPLTGINASVCAHIILGHQKSAPQNWIDALKKAYAEQPSNDISPISQEDCDFLQAEAERTRLGGKSIFKYVQNPPEGMNAKICSDLVSGRKKTALQSWVDALKEAYAGQPDTNVIPLPKDDLAFLQAEKKRTGLGGTAIFKYIQNPPENMNAKVCVKIISGVQKSAPQNWINVLKKIYAQQPTKRLLPPSPSGMG